MLKRISGWVPKKVLLGHEHKVFILDFFGSQHGLRGNSLKVPLKRFLTAFGSPWNSFLGYYIAAPNVSIAGIATKESCGVIWGKDAKHFEGRVPQLQTVADSTPLYATSTSQVFKHRNVHWLGHQTSSQWHKLLAKSKFLIGLGNPLLGPSALDAVSSGCVFVNPVYRTPAYNGQFKSQHPYAADRIGMPYVCSYQEQDEQQLMDCVRHALRAQLPRMIPPDFQQDVYINRVRDIFSQ